MRPVAGKEAPLVACRGLGKVYRIGSGEVAALHGLTLTITSGELVAVTGASGSGKSTFMNLHGALDQPSTGSI